MTMTNEPVSQFYYSDRLKLHFYLKIPEARHDLQPELSKDDIFKLKSQIEDRNKRIKKLEWQKEELQCTGERAWNTTRPGVPFPRFYLNTLLQPGRTYT